MSFLFMNDEVAHEHVTLVALNCERRFAGVKSLAMGVDIDDEKITGSALDDIRTVDGFAM